MAEVAASEGLRPVPERAYPAVVEVARSVSWGALVSFEGNRYSVPPAYVDGHVLVHAPLGASHIELRSLDGEVLRTHRRAPTGAGALVRLASDRAELERLVLRSFSTAPPCRRKPNNPPSQAARALAAEIRSAHKAAGGPQSTSGGSGHRSATRGNVEDGMTTVVSLERYAEWVKPS